MIDTHALSCNLYVINLVKKAGERVILINIFNQSLKIIYNRFLKVQG